MRIATKKYAAIALISMILLAGQACSVGAASGGLVPSWLLVRFAGINERLASAGLPQLPSGLFLLGGGGTGNSAPGWALGGWVAYGSTGASAMEHAVRLTLALGGPLLEYSEPLQENSKNTIFIGGFFGLGEGSLEIIIRPPASFADALRKPSGASMVRQFIALMPYAGSAWNIGSLQIELALGYLWLAGTSNWQADGRDLPGPGGLLSAPLLQLRFSLHL